MSSWPKDIGFTGCHLICSDVKLVLLCSRHSSPGCPRILANSDSVQKYSHVRILLCLASLCLVGTPCCPLSYIAQPVFFFEVGLPDGQLLPHWRRVWQMPQNWNAVMPHRISSFLLLLVPNSRALRAADLRVTLGHNATV